MTPEEEFKKNEKKKERQLINDVTSTLSEKEMDILVKFSNELKKRQATEDSKEALATIPTISVNDIDSRIVDYSISTTRNAFKSGVTIILHEVPSTGIIYIDFGVDISMVPFSDAMAYLPLYESLMIVSGTKDFSSEALMQEISMHTGGIEVNTIVSPVKKRGSSDNVVYGDNHMVTKLIFRGKSLASPHKVNKLFSIYRSILTNTKLDNQMKAVEILRSRCSDIESSIQGSGTSFAYDRVGSKHSATGIFDEYMNGVSSLYVCREILIEAENNWPRVLKNLETISSLILEESTVRSGMVLNLTGGRNELKEITKILQQFLNSLPGKSNGENLPNYFTKVHPWVKEARKLLKSPNNDEALIVPTKVNYVVSGKKIFHSDEIVEGSAFVAVQKMNTDYLWNNVRVLGGAYGSHGKLRLTDGFFAFMSHRDPNIIETLKFYDGAADYLLEEANRLEDNPEELEKSIVSSIGSFDGGPLSPMNIGWISFNNWLTGVNKSAQEKLRKEILQTKPNDLKKFAKRLKASKNQYSVAVVTSEISFENVLENGKDFTFVNVVGTSQVHNVTQKTYHK